MSGFIMEHRDAFKRLGLGVVSTNLLLAISCATFTECPTTGFNDANTSSDLRLDAGELFTRGVEIEKDGNETLWFTLWNASYKNIFLVIGPNPLVEVRSMHPTAATNADDALQTLLFPSRSHPGSPTLRLLSGLGSRSPETQYSFSCNVHAPSNTAGSVFVRLHFNIDVLTGDRIATKSIERSFVMRVKDLSNGVSTIDK